MSRENWELYFAAVKKLEWTKARNVLDEIAKAENANPQVYLKMGDVCQRAGDTSSAVKAYHISARIQCLQGFSQKAIALYKIILRLDPHNAEALSKTEQLMNELEASRGRHFQPPPMPQRQAEIKGLPEAGPVPSPSPPPLHQTASPEVSGWLEGTSHASDESAEEIPGKTEEQETHADDLSVGPVWLQTTTYETSDTGPGKNELSEETVVEEPGITPGGTYALDTPFTKLEDIPSIEEIITELADDDFQKLLDDMVVPLAEREAADSKIPELFSGMSEEEYFEVRSELAKKIYLNNSYVIEEGDSGDSMYIIKSGTARVIAHMFGREVELARLGEGDLFGEVAFLTGRPRTASVIADGTIEVYEIGRFDIERLIDRNPEILSKLEGFNESRVKDTIQKIMPKR